MEAGAKRRGQTSLERINFLADVIAVFFYRHEFPDNDRQEFERVLIDECRQVGHLLRHAVPMLPLAETELRRCGQRSLLGG